VELEGSAKHRLEQFIAQNTGAERCAIVDMNRLGGGAIQENWCLDVAVTGGAFAGHLETVLRTDAASKVAVSLTRGQEFALLKTAFDAGVTVPEPLWMCGDISVLGKEFFIMRRVSGDAAGHRLVKTELVRDSGEVLVERLAQELARIHGITPPAKDLDFLVLPEPTPARYWVTQFRKYLDSHPEPHPLLEWALRWLELNAPVDVHMVLCHHDFRTGNLMVDGSTLTGILDWEFAGWSDFHEDLGWFCAKCWRFGADNREAGGLGGRETFYKSYEEATGRLINHDTVIYWEAMAHVRWAIIALQQAQRFLSGEESSLEAALTGHVVPGLEFELLKLTGKES
jgi:aminoglycoside phosphotransferase (APT) family kinase protein